MADAQEALGLEGTLSPKGSIDPKSKGPWGQKTNAIFSEFSARSKHKNLFIGSGGGDCQQKLTG